MPLTVSKPALQPAPGAPWSPDAAGGWGRLGTCSNAPWFYTIRHPVSSSAGSQGPLSPRFRPPRWLSVWQPHPRAPCGAPLGRPRFFLPNECLQESFPAGRLCKRSLGVCLAVCTPPPFAHVGTPETLSPPDRFIPDHARAPRRAEGSPGVSEGRALLSLRVWYPEGSRPHFARRPAVRGAPD